MMDVKDPDLGAARVAAAIGEPARARMLYALMDGRARTSTELAVIANITPSTASVHLKRLSETHLVRSAAQGKHRYFALLSGDVANALEALNILGGRHNAFKSSTPDGLRAARTCYDHIAGSLGIAIHDRLMSMGWLSGASEYELSPAGEAALRQLGVSIETPQTSRRRFAYACLDWSERRPHLAGWLGAAILDLALRRKWLNKEADGRALTLTRHGRQGFRSEFGVPFDGKGI